MAISGNSTKRIKFFKPQNKEVYDLFLDNKKLINEYDFNNEIDIDVAKNYFYFIKTMFNPTGFTDIVLESHEKTISEYIWSSHYNLNIDFVWTNSKYNKLNNISFVKIFENDLSNTEPSDYEKEIDAFFHDSKIMIENLNSILKYENEDSKEKQSQHDQKAEEIKDLLNIQYEQNDKLKRDKPKESWNLNNIEFHYYFYFPSSDQNDENDKKTMIDKIENIKKKYSNSTKWIFNKEHVITEDDLTNAYNEIQSSVLVVKEGKLELDDLNNFLVFRSKDKRIKDSYIVNISALSLNELWKKHKNNLLGMNLKLHVTNKNVDKEINNSIQTEKDLFWFKNNGLVIICSGAKIKNKSITLENFSIINGGQTTFNIGNSDIIDKHNNFYIMCKVIIIKHFKADDIDLEIQQLSTDIALSTNNQKPIKKTDKISSISECRLLKQELHKKNYFYEIRRGDKPNKKLKPYEKIKAENLNQIYYAFFNLRPGSSRNKVANIFTDECLKDATEHMLEIYRQFNEQSEIIFDLIKIFYILNDNSKKANLKKVMNDERFLNLSKQVQERYEKDFVTNFKYYALSALCILFVFYKNESIIESLKDDVDLIHENYYKEEDIKNYNDVTKKIIDFWNQNEYKSIFKKNDYDWIKTAWNGLMIKHFYSIFFEGIKARTGADVPSWTNFTKPSDYKFGLIIFNIIKKWDNIKGDLGNLFK